MAKFKPRPEDPPAPRYGRGSSSDTVVALLRADPGRWYVVAERDAATSAGTVLAAYWRRRFAAEGFEFVARTVVDGGQKVCRIYGRYTPPAKED